MESYEYTANGNRTKVNGTTTEIGVDNQLLFDGTHYYSYSTGELHTSNLSGDTNWYFYDLRHRLIGVSYFKDGEQWEIAYDYDAFDRLVGRRVVVSGFTYVFDPETEELISAEPYTNTMVNERRIYDGANMVLELVPDFYNPQVQRRLLYGPAIDQVLVQERGSSADDIDWFLTDNQGTVRDIVDNNRNHDAHYTYDSFGKPLTGMELNGQGVPADGYVLGRLRVLYTGKEYDPLTHIQYNMMRWYSANAGRFITKDPLGLGPDSNPYRYGGNSPTNRTDSLGLDWRQDSIGGRTGKPLPGPTISDLIDIGGFIGGIFLEPLDWAMTAREIYNDPRSPYSYAGLIPIVPAGAGRLGKAGAKAAKVVKAAEACPIRLHHSWAKYLGGAEKQSLVPMSKTMHDAYHSGLDKILPRQWGTQYYDALQGGARDEMYRLLRDYTKAFDSKNGTLLLDAMRKEGFPL